jgi:O-antigen ligase
MISARISAITLIFIFILYFIFYLKTSLIKKAILTIIFFSLISGLVSINNNIRERFFLTGSFNEFMIKLNLHEPRVVIWDCAFDISQRDDFNPLIGFSSKLEIENLFKECFGEKISNKYRASYFFESINNSHNQFINTYLVSGLIGLILFSSFFILQLIQHRRIFFKTAMLISLIFFLLVENMLSREFGVYIFCLTILLIETDWIDENFKKRI